MWLLSKIRGSLLGGFKEKASGAEKLAENDPGHPIYYSPLNPDQLRLVALQPGHKHDSIECKIECATFKFAKEKYKYKALSYMWGSPDKLRPISINGDTFHVRENLWWALYHLRSTGYVVMLWIDALCINQADIDERNSQVRQMDRIYTDAEEVIIWVGRESSKDKNALKYLQEIFKKGRIPDSFNPEVANPLGNAQWFERYLYMWKEISIFCMRPYWTRLWIVQEAVLGTNPTIICGNQRMNWQIVHDVVYSAPLVDYQFKGKWKDIRVEIGSSPLRGVITQRGRWTRAPGSLPILGLIAVHRAARCSETRDKVFGLLSMSSPCCREAIPVDYSEPDYVLFVKLIEHHLRKHDVYRYNFMMQSRRALRLFFGEQSDSDLESSIGYITNMSSDDNELFEVPPQINDVVYYCTPSLDSLPPDYDKTFLDDKDDWSPSGNLAFEINKLHDRLQARWETLLSDLNNIQTFDWKASLQDPKKIGGLENGSLPLHKDSTSAIDKSLVRKTVVRMIRGAEKMSRDSPLSANCKLFFAKGGRIGFGPSTLKRGDFLCHFNDSGMDMILRLLPNEKKLITVGNVLPYFASDLPVQEDTAAARPMVSFHLDIRTLLLIGLPENAAQIAKKILPRTGQEVSFFLGSTRWKWRPSYGSDELIELDDQDYSLLVS